MKIFVAILTLFSCIGLASCIQDEALNAECDIETCYVECNDYDSVFFSKSEMSKSVNSTDSVISFLIRDNADVSAMRVFFTVTEGARVYVLNGGVPKEYVDGTELDFSDSSHSFRVVSENGVWHRDYRVNFTQVDMPSDYHFSHFELGPQGCYYQWFEYDEVGRRINMWATGNPGFRLSKSSAKVDEYPSVAVPDGYIGDGVKLETRSTGGFGAMVNMRLAAGNIFIGTFDVEYALEDAMMATCMGLPYRRKPITYSGYYHYKRGEVFQDRNGNPVSERLDNPDLYAVFYKNTDDEGNAVVLHGDDVMTHPNIVAIARVENPVVGEEWTYFEVPFEYIGDVSPELLRNAGYSLTVVCTSSIDGGTFCGAVGSTLWVDEVKVTSIDL